MKHQEKTKAKMADFLRKMLGVDIEFERLEKKDLEKLYNLFSQSSLFTFFKIARKSAKNIVLEKHPLLKKADTLTTVLLSFLRS